MKKLLIASAIAALLSACSSTGTSEISASRGANHSRITKAEIEQYNKQRANEIYESRTRTEKVKGYTDSVKEGASAVREVVDVIRNIRSVFGR